MELVSKHKFLFEIFDEISAAKGKAEKIALLKKHSTMGVKNILKGAFDDTIVWLLPDGDPPYQPAVKDTQFANLEKKVDTLKYFVKGGASPDMLQIKRESMFVRLLETIHPADAVLLISAINKKSPATGLTKAMVKEVFPDLIKK